MKRLVLVLAVFVLVAAPLIAAIWMLIVPKYEARGEVRIRPIIPRLVFQTEDNGVIPFYESFVNTQLSLITSPTVLQRTLDQRQVQATAWYKNHTKTLREWWRGEAVPPLERLKNGLCAEPRPRTEIIDVSFTDVNAKDAKTIVDAVLEQYIKYVGEASDATEDLLCRQLTDQYKSLESEIQGREKICAELHRSLGTAAPQELISSRRGFLDETQARLNQLRDRIAVLEWETKHPDGTSDGNRPVDPSPRQPKYHEDAEWRKLDLGVRMAQHQIDNSSLSPNYPDQVRLTKDWEFAKELRLLREQQLDEQWKDHLKDRAGRGDGVVPVERRLTLARVEEQLLRAEWERQEKEFQSLFESAQLLEKENAALQRKRELFDAVRQRIDRKTMERGVPGAIEILTGASLPSQPAHDRRILFTAGALALGLCVAGGFSLLTRRRNRGGAQGDQATA